MSIAALPVELISRYVAIWISTIRRSEVIMPRIEQKLTGKFCEDILPKNPFHYDKRNSPQTGRII
jgi:hypothetical protein